MGWGVGGMAPQTKMNTCEHKTEIVLAVTALLTCTSHGGGVLDSPVEAFVAVADGGSLVMAGAM